MIRLDLVEVGSRVAYEDAANPRREGRVSAILLDGREFAVSWDDPEGDETSTISDLRQPGWSLLADLPGNPFDGADIIYAYTRIDAIRDGELVPATDLTPDEPDFPRQAGFRAPVCLTRAVAALVSPNDREQTRGQDVKGRLWDVLNMARFYRPAEGRGGEQTWLYPCLVYVSGRPEFRGGGTRKLVFKCVIGPDESGEPAVTIMRREES